MPNPRNTEELILTGSPDAVQRLLGRAASEISGLGEVRSLVVNHGSRTMKLGLVRMGQGPLEIMHRLAGWARAERAAVRAELNCATGRPFRVERGARGWNLDPWNWGDNPWTWGDNPWNWGDNPWGWGDNPVLPMVVAAGATPAEGEVLFWRQGAFRHIGLTDEAGLRIPALADHMGEGVLAGVFDALPSKPVSYPWLALHPGRTPQEQPWDDRDLSDHGLVCASLIHAVAPRARIHLYEVCGKAGHGRLFPLLEALAEFIDLAAGKPAVISLSLGSLEFDGSAALRVLLQKATDMGMVVCASAGNAAHGTPKVSALLPAQVPAAFPNVLAVSSSNLSGERATYSQRGDIAAPGGEDLGHHGPDDPEDIIGCGVSVGTSGYVRMDAGTSFATPLVAGAAALLLEGMAVRDAGTYARVLEALKAAARQGAPTAGETLAGAGLGAGILYLPTLFHA
ncbi:MAG TPA: S8/S53 family peptidase [Symbiobacteriaceae bacterium]|nr:S8/S53 family peptidase [Symbiobacteriaceae bacterium]